jgi:hypothetical protein
MGKQSLAMITALPRSISSGTTALTRALASPFFQVSMPGEGRVVPLPPRGLPTEVEAAIRWNPPAVKALLEAVAHADPPAVKALLEAVAHAAGALG